MGFFFRFVLNVLVNFFMLLNIVILDDSCVFIYLNISLIDGFELYVFKMMLFLGWFFWGIEIIRDGLC